MNASGADPSVLTTVSAADGEEAVILGSAWDAKGETIAFAVGRAAPHSWRQELWALPLDDHRTAAAEPAKLYAEEAATEYAFSPARWNGLPAWSDDGRLLFGSDRGGSPQVWSVRPDGSDLHAITPLDAVWPALGSDGLYFVRLDSDTAFWRVATDGSRLAPLDWPR
jgi:Tol biopolymer transport system component